jgi:hypothetical protein
VLDGEGTVRVSDTAGAAQMQIEVSHPGAYALIEHARHTAGVLGLQIGPGVHCLATCFTPGVA